MPEIFNARRAAKELLQGIAPARPLFLPIAFSIGARIENLPLRSFLSNPTKIVSAIRQLRAHLHADAVTSYFDPFLELEALGATIEWDAAAQNRSLRWPASTSASTSRAAQLPENLRAPADLPTAGHVPVAVDVISRLRTLFRDDCLLMARVSGPYTLAAMLAQNVEATADSGSAAQSEIFEAALALAADAIASIARALVEAGANAILIHEQLPAPTQFAAASGTFEDWLSPFTQTLNIVRFYEALPILILPPLDPTTSATATATAQRATNDWIVCPSISLAETNSLDPLTELRGTAFGIAIPPNIFESSDNAQNHTAVSAVRRIVSDSRPAIITTSGEISPSTDIKQLNSIGDAVRA